MAQVSFKMPWGRMSGLSFGNRASKNVFLCLHGWQDNSALYKPLLQNLPQENHYLALDLMARMPNIFHTVKYTVESKDRSAKSWCIRTI